MRYDAEKIADYAEAMSKRRSGAPEIRFRQAAACTSQPAATRSRWCTLANSPALTN
jgi:hypothetical protein